MSGWIKLHRQIEESVIYQKPEYLKMWIHILIKANHSPREEILNGESVLIPSGSFVTGRKKLSNETRISESKTERILKFLEIEQQIEQQKTNKYRVIAVLNWNRYQGSEQQSEQQMNNRWTTNEQQMDTIIKNVKKEKNYKKDNSLPDFEIFWSKYNYKIGKPDCIDYWIGRKRLKNGKQMDDEMRKKCLSVIDKYVKNTHKDDTYPSRKHPKTYLYNSCWDDEIVQIETKANKINIDAMIRKSDFGRGETDPILREAVKRCGGFRSLGLMRDIPYKQACDQIEKEYKRLKGE